MRTFYDIVVRPLRLNAAGNKINWKGVELLLTVPGMEWNDVNYDGGKRSRMCWSSPPLWILSRLGQKKIGKFPARLSPRRPRHVLQADSLLSSPSSTLTASVWQLGPSQSGRVAVAEDGVRLHKQLLVKLLFSGPKFVFFFNNAAPPPG